MLIGADEEVIDFPDALINLSMPRVASVLHGVPFFNALRIFRSEKVS
jgi:hypothetical protein